MTKTVYDDETKALAIYSLLTGNSYEYVSKEFDIPEGTLKSWKSEVLGSRSGASIVASEKKHQIGDLLLGLLEQEIITLQAIARMAANEDWSSKQEANDLAMFYGVMQDKAVRKIEALSGARNTD
mgnify:FL=1